MIEEIAKKKLIELGMEFDHGHGSWRDSGPPSRGFYIDVCWDRLIVWDFRNHVKHAICYADPDFFVKVEELLSGNNQ